VAAVAAAADAETCIAAAAGRSIDAPAAEEHAMHYVDGMVTPVPKAKLAEYRRMSRLCGKVWMEHGALQYVECVGDDVKPGKSTSFPQAVKLKDGEVVMFSWIVYRNRRDRDRINKLVMADPRLAAMMDPKKMPFDARRMFWGGFKQMIAL
jgi:uncharacterized protein YbaA (DUF1428 family)